MKTKIKIVLSIVVFGAIGFVAAQTLLGKKEQVATLTTPKPLSSFVNLSAVSHAVIEESQEFLATFKPLQSVTISTNASGFVSSLFVHEAQKVQKAEPLLKIDTSVIDAEIAALGSTQEANQAELALAQNRYKRDELLYAKGGVSKEQLEQSRASLLASQAKLSATHNKLKALQNQKSYYELKAPFDGEIASVLVYAGDLAAPNKALLKLNSHVKKLTFAFTHNRVEPGQSVFLKKQKIGVVSAIYPDAHNGLKIAEVALQSPLDYKNAESITIRVVFKQKSGCALPNNAILKNERERFVLLKRAHGFEKREIKIVAQNEQVAILKECFEGEVALGSPNKLVALAAQGVRDANE